MAPDQFQPSPPATDARVRDAFVDALRACGSVAAASRKVGLSPQALYRARLKFPEFAAAWTAAAVIRKPRPGNRARLEAALIERVLKGVACNRYFGGKVIGTDLEYSDALALGLMRLLLAREALAPGGGGRSDSGGGDGGEPTLTRIEMLARIEVARRTDDLDREARERDVLVAEHRELNPLAAE